MSFSVKDHPLIIEAKRDIEILSTDREKNRELIRSRQKFINDLVIIIGAARTDVDIEIARRMINKGYDTDAIIDVTDLSRWEVEQLR